MFAEFAPEEASVSAVIARTKVRSNPPNVKVASTAVRSRNDGVTSNDDYIQRVVTSVVVPVVSSKVPVPQPVKVSVSLFPTSFAPAAVGVVSVAPAAKVVLTVPPVGVQQVSEWVTPVKTAVPTTFIRLW